MSFLRRQESIITTMNLNSSRKNKWSLGKRNWFFMAGTVFFILFIWSLPSELPMNIVYLTKAYSEPEICEAAFEMTKKNPKVLEILGELEPMGSLDMLNGSVFYSKGGDSVAITINVEGNKEIKNIRPKLDVVAFRIDGNWEYQKIQIRIKNPVEMREIIPILKK